VDFAPIVGHPGLFGHAAMNAVYALRPRLERALLAGKKTLGGGMVVRANRTPRLSAIAAVVASAASNKRTRLRCGVQYR